MTLLSGLPGTGKDTWIAQHCPEADVISLDAIRKELGVSPRESQNRVLDRAREQARELLRQKQPFVWNATSLTPELRRKSVELFEAYQASVRIVFLETGWEEGLRRNRERGKKAVVLTCKEHMIPFYQKIGYRYIEVSDSVHGGAVWHKMMYVF